MMFTKKSRWSVMLHRLCFFISKALLMDRLTSSSCKLQLPFEVQQKRADTIRNQVASLPPKLLCCRLSEQLSAARVHFRLVHKAKRSEAHPANRERRLCAETFVLSFFDRLSAASSQLRNQTFCPREQRFRGCWGDFFVKVPPTRVCDEVSRRWTGLLR